MIKSINSINATPIRSNTNFGTGKKDVQEYEIVKRKKTSAAGYIGKQFAAGALFSTIVDGVFNGIGVLRKKPDSVLPASQVAKKAGLMGFYFAVLGGIFAGIDAVVNKK